VERVEVDADGVEIAVEAVGPQSDFSFDLVLEPGQAHGRVTFADVVDGAPVSATYNIAIIESQVERKAVAHIIADCNRRSSSQRHDYYPAIRSGSKVFISANGLSSAQAQNRGRAGQDVWAIRTCTAFTAARSEWPFCSRFRVRTGAFGVRPHLPGSTIGEVNGRL